MRSHRWTILASCCAAMLALLLFTAPVSAQDRSEEERRSGQTRDQDERDNQNARSQSRDRDQQSREQQNFRDRDQSRDQSQYREQSQYRDQSQYRESRDQDRSDQDAGLGVMLRAAQDGVQVQQIFLDSPAERAGLRRGDFLLSIDDERVRSVQDVMQLIRQKDPDSWVDLQIWRNGQRHTIEARLASRQQAFGEQGQRQLGTSQGQQSRDMQWPGQFQERNQQSLAQQIQALQRQLAQLRQEVNELRSERQVLRPNLDDRQRSEERGRTFDGQRQSDRDSNQQQSSQRSQRDY